MGTFSKTFVPTGLLCGVVSMMAGCSSPPAVPPSFSLPERSVPTWEEAVEGPSSRSWLPPLEDATWGLPRVTVNIGPVPADVAASVVAELAGVGVAIPAGESPPVVVVGNELPAERMFRMIADAAGWRVEYTDGLVSFEDSKGSGERGELVVSLPTGYLAADQIITSLNGLLGATRARTVGDRVLVSLDAPDVPRVRRWVAAAYEAPASWRVDVRVLSISSNLYRQWGASAVGTGSVDLAANLNAGPGNGGTSAALVGEIGARVLASLASGRFEGRVES